MDESESCYLIKNGKPTGPYTLRELKNHHLRGTDFIRLQSQEDFKELREQPALAAYLGVAFERTPPQYFASLDVRLLALAIDYFIASTIYGLFAVAILMQIPDKSQRLYMLLTGLILIPILKFCIAVIAEGSRYNATPGKYLLHIKVTDLGGNPIGLARSFARNSAKSLGLITFGIGFLSGFFDRKQQCLHDKVARTLVTKERLI